MSDFSLETLVQQVRWKTLALLSDVDDAQSAFTSSGLNNSILWHAGHSLVIVERLCFPETPASESPVSAEWEEKFTCPNPAAVTEWPMLSEVVAKLTDQRARLLLLIEKMIPKQLNRVTGQAPLNRTFHELFVHALHDEACHQGEIHLLKKQWRLRDKSDAV